MSVTKSYPRLKAAPTISTGLVLTLKAAEYPTTPDSFRDNAGSVVAGTTGILDCRVQCDADESGGADVQDLWKIVATPSIDSSGVMTLAVTVTPIKGDATAGTPGSVTVTHDENADVWQTAAGRARQ